MWLCECDWTTALYTFCVEDVGLAGVTPTDMPEIPSAALSMATDGSCSGWGDGCDGWGDGWGDGRDGWGDGRDGWGDGCDGWGDDCFCWGCSGGWGELSKSPAVLSCSHVLCVYVN